MRVVLAIAASIVAVGAVARADEDKLPCTTPRPTMAAVCACLKKEAPYGDKCEPLAKGKTASAQAVRAGGMQGTTIYVVVKQSAGWAVVYEMLYEQGHGKRSSSLSMRSASESTIAGHTVVRFDYKTSDEIVGNNDDGSDGSQYETETSALCAIGGRCVEVDTKCKGEDDGEDGSFKGDLVIDAARGTVKVVGKHVGATKVCAPLTSGELALWGNTQTGHAFAPSGSCTVAEAKAHFYSDDGKPRPAYVQKGDSVDVTPAPAPLSSEFVSARFKGAKRETFGLLKKSDLSCAATTP